jgi:DNA-binding response OmpR family regulator
MSHVSRDPHKTRPMVPEEEDKPVLGIDRDYMRAFVDGRWVTLTALQFRIYEIMFARMNKRTDSWELASQIWEYAMGVTLADDQDLFVRLRVHIMILRRRLGDNVRQQRIIRSWRGGHSGYMLIGKAAG